MRRPGSGLTLPAMALTYAGLGWPVIPLHSPGNGPTGCDCRRSCGSNAAKHPRTTHGVSDATTDVEIVARWWRTWSQANIGLATGARSGLVVLDVDPRAGGDASLAGLIERFGPLPQTPCVFTGGGGLHYYFAHPGRTVKNNAGKLGTGLDVRGDGGYVVASPSVHVSGQAYLWAEACDLAPLPAWLDERIDSADEAAYVDTAAALAGVLEGERDETLFRLACKLRRVDVPRDVTEDLVLRAAAACVPPFPASDALRKVASAYERYSPTTEATVAVSRKNRLVNLR